MISAKILKSEREIYCNYDNCASNNIKKNSLFLYIKISSKDLGSLALSYCFDKIHNDLLPFLDKSLHPFQ